MTPVLLLGRVRDLTSPVQGVRSAAASGFPGLTPELFLRARGLRFPIRSWTTGALCRSSGEGTLRRH